MTVTATERYTTQVKATPSERAYTAVYQCETTSTSEGPIDVRASLPSLGTSFTGDPQAVVTGYGRISPKSFEQGHQTTWDAVVNYSTVPDKNNGDCTTNIESPPWEKPARLSGGGTEERINVGGEEDNAGRKINNSAGYPFEDLQVSNSQPMLHIERDYLASQFDLQTLWDSTYTVNSVAFFGLLPRSWRLDPPQWRKQGMGTESNCQDYYTVLYTFRANYRGWDLRPRDEGAFDQNQLALKINQHVYPGVWPLDGNGNFATAGGGAVFFDGLNGNPQPFEWYSPIDFGQVLGVPTS